MFVDLPLITDLAMDGKNIVIAGLFSDSNGKIFPSMALALANSDSCERLAAVCSCGERAPFTVDTRKEMSAPNRNFPVKKLKDLVAEGGDKAAVGGLDRYLSVCRRCRDSKIV